MRTVWFVSPFARAVRTKSESSVLMMPLRRLRMSTAESCSESVRAGKKRELEMLREGSSVAGDGEEMQPEAEEQDEQDAEPEARRREREEEPGADQVVRELVLVRRRPEADRERNDRAQRHRIGREEERDGDAPEDEAVDRLPVEERIAEVAVGDTGDEMPVLERQRLIEAELMPQSAAFSSVARSPRIRKAGSPGTRWIMLKMISVTPKRTKTISSSRLRIYVARPNLLVHLHVRDSIA